MGTRSSRLSKKQDRCFCIALIAATDAGQHTLSGMAENSGKAQFKNNIQGDDLLEPEGDVAQGFGTGGSCADLESDFVLEEVFEWSVEESDISSLVGSLNLHAGMLGLIMKSHKRNGDFWDSVFSTKQLGHARKQKYVRFMEPVRTKGNQSMDLSNCKLSYLTTNIGLIYGVTELKLCDNALYKLPEEVGWIEGLKRLDISKNQLCALPEAIGNLKSLAELKADNNRLTALPKGLFRLKNLTILIISHNYVREIPREVGLLERLAVLEAENNMLQSLPFEISLLINLKKLIVAGCPLLRAENLDQVARKASSRGAISLLELASRKAVEEGSKLGENLTFSLANYLCTARECAFCHKPFFIHRVVRIRMIQRQDRRLPVVYEMCSAHWSNEYERIQAMFQIAPETASQVPKSKAKSRRPSILLGLPIEKILGGAWAAGCSGKDGRADLTSKNVPSALDTRSRVKLRSRNISLNSGSARDPKYVEPDLAGGSGTTSRHSLKKRVDLANPWRGFRS